MNAMCAALLAAGMVCTTVPGLGEFLVRADENGVTLTDTEEDIKIDEDHFPDEEFRAVIGQEFDTDQDGILSEKEIEEAKTLNCLGCKIYDITGIEYLTELEELQCGFNTLREIDISSNTKLKSLDCYDTKLTSLDLSGNPELEYLCCSDNKLTKLDLSSNTKLKQVECYENLITDLDISKNTELLSINCYGNRLKELDTTNNPKLEILSCGYNPIESVDVSKNPKLQEFWCYGGSLTTIDLSHHADLHIVSLAENPLTDLYLFDCPIMLDLMKVSPLQREVNPYTGTEYLYSEFDFEKDGQPLHCFIYFNSTATLVTDKEPPKPVAPEPSTPQPEPATPAPVSDPTFSDFVERLYTIALGRASEADGKAYWEEQVIKKGLTGADCVRFFLLNSPEFMNRDLPNDQFVEVLYQTLFGRAPEADGKTYWLGRLSSGTTKTDMVNELIESVEWCNTCATYGVKSGAKSHKATVASKNATKFATRLYTCCLGRDPEAEGLTYWSLALTNLDATGYQAASLFFTLPEFTGLKTTNEEYLTRLYKTFMGREPETDGFNYWLGLLSGGKDRNEVMKAFAACPEFQEICNSYGIVRGEI